MKKDSITEKYWINWDVVDKVKIGGSMGYWKLGNEIESISHRIESVKAIIELVADGIQDNSYSNSLWGSADILGIYIEQLEELSQQAIDMHRIEKEDAQATLVAKKATPVAKKATKVKK